MATRRATGSKSKTLGQKVTDKASAGVTKAARAASPEDDSVPGPSPNGATNLIIHDLALRTMGRLSRHTLEKGLLGRRYGREFAKDVVDNRSLLHTALAYGATRIATRSLPGAAVVWGGLLAKTLYDRRKGKRAAAKSGDKVLRDAAKSGPIV